VIFEDGAVELLNVLFPHLAGVHVERVVGSGRVVRFEAATRAPAMGRRLTAWAIGQGEEVGSPHVDAHRQAVAALGAAWCAWSRRSRWPWLGPGLLQDRRVLQVTGFGQCPATRLLSVARSKTPWPVI